MIGFKKIDLPFATDLIAERFDNILELLHPNAFVYGGALRDLAAGLPMEGDLDIVASGGDYDHSISKIGNSSKWRSCRTGVIANALARRKEPSYESNRTVRSVCAFETFGNRRVELVRAKAQFSRTNISASFGVVKTVDLNCCGLVMDIYGSAYEVVKGAYQDCLDRVLRLNKLDSCENIEALKNRIVKLEKRGWSSKVNISRASKMLKKIEEAAAKEYAKKMKTNIRTTVKSKLNGVIELKIFGIGQKITGFGFLEDIIRDTMHRIHHTVPCIVKTGKTDVICVELQVGKITKRERQVAEILAEDLRAGLEHLNKGRKKRAPTKTPYSEYKTSTAYKDIKLRKVGKTRDAEMFFAPSDEVEPSDLRDVELSDEREVEGLSYEIEDRLRGRRSEPNFYISGGKAVNPPEKTMPEDVPDVATYGHIVTDQTLDTVEGNVRGTTYSEQVEPDSEQVELSTSFDGVTSFDSYAKVIEENQGEYASGGIIENVANKPIAPPIYHAPSRTKSKVRVKKRVKRRKTS